MTSFALYEAYGTRPYEWGDDPDRQKANTKEEESDLGLLNEGMRFRDLETGVFLTRDPIGYGDGPNVYCYVRANPIMAFDPLGLKLDLTKSSAEGRALLQDMAKNDERFAAQLLNWANSDRVVTIDNTTEGTHADKYTYNEDGTIKDVISGGGAYVPRSSPENETDAGNPSKGTDVTIAFSATETLTENGKTYSPRDIVKHEGQHTTDSINGVRDPTPTSTGVPKHEERADRTLNEGKSEDDMKTHHMTEGKPLPINDYNVPLEDAVPEVVVSEPEETP